MVSAVKRIQTFDQPEIYYEQRLRDIFMMAADNREG